MLHPLYQKMILLAIGLATLAVVLSVYTLFSLYQFETALVTRERGTSFTDNAFENMSMECNETACTIGGNVIEST